MSSSALPNAARDGDLEKVQCLLNQGIDVDSTDEDGNTALIIASNEGHIDIVQLLLKKNAKLDIQATEGGSTALICASAEGHLEIVKALLTKNSNVDIQNQYGCTALLLSSSHGQLEVVRALLEKGAKVDIQDEDGDTALICACRYGAKDGVRVLLEHGADTRIKNKAGKIARDDCTKELAQMLDEVRNIHTSFTILQTFNPTLNLKNIDHSVLVFILFCSKFARSMNPRPRKQVSSQQHKRLSWCWNR
jgi:ankyrin repeat protein